MDVDGFSWMSGGVFITHPLALHTSTCSSHLHRTESESCTFVQVALLCRNFDNFSGVIFDKRSIVQGCHLLRFFGNAPIFDGLSDKPTDLKSLLKCSETASSLNLDLLIQKTAHSTGRCPLDPRWG